MASSSEYVWFLSDDDNIEDGAIDSIFGDIKKYSPNAIYYNFNQHPHGYQNPYIVKMELYAVINETNLDSISKIIKNPKLSAIVIKRLSLNEDFNKYMNSFCIQVLLSIQVGFDHGRLLHSSHFVAYPDVDYMDHVDFPPYIGNNQNLAIRRLLLMNGKEHICSRLSLSNVVDPIGVGLSTLGCYYRGNFVLSKGLKHELYSTIQDEIKRRSLIDICTKKNFIGVAKFIVSVLFNLIARLVTGRNISRDSAK